MQMFVIFFFFFHFLAMLWSMWVFSSPVRIELMAPCFESVES